VEVTKLSVVVPFFNVGRYLEECLDSLARQTLTEVEVIMVDDGSTDDSALLAKAYADRDPRFKLVQQQNQGLGPARNSGVRVASGEYLVFADSDDVIPPHAYELMVGSLERSGSDFASGNVLRLEQGITTQSWLHRELKTPALRTHVTRDPRLLRDRTAWNKVFRRSFWDAHDFRFPKGWYEDSPVTVPAHVLATAVDVIDEPVYLWRRREDSISEGRADADNLDARITVMRGVRDFLVEQCPELIDAYDSVVLDIDLKILARALPSVPEDKQDTLLEHAAQLIGSMSPALVAGRPAPERLGLRLLAERRPDELHEVLNDLYVGGGLKVVRRGERWYADYPFLDEDLDLTGELKPVARIDEAEWIGGASGTAVPGRPALRIKGRAYFAGLPVDGQKVQVWLRAPGRLGPAVRAMVKIQRRGTEFTAVIPARRLRLLHKVRPGSWKLIARVSADGLARKHPFGVAPGVLAPLPDERELTTKVRARLIGSENRFMIRLGGPVETVVAAERGGSGWQSVMEEELLRTGVDPEQGAYRSGRDWLAGR
jgi:CDP-glycerol glycerophosphotransferase